MTLKNSGIRLRRYLYKGYQSKTPFQLLNQHFEGSLRSLQIFYGLLFFITLKYIGFIGLQKNTGDLHPPFAFSFLSRLSPALINAVLMVTPWIALLCFLNCRRQWVRITTFVAFLFSYAYTYSFNQSYHGEMIFVYTSFAFSLIPTWSKNKTLFPRKSKHLHNHLYWFGLFLFMLPYTFSGLWKVFWGMGFQLFFDELSFWNPSSMINIISTYALRTGHPAPLVDFLMNHAIFAYGLLMAGIYWEVIAILPLFRPSHWRFTALLLLILHLLSIYIFNIKFQYQILAGLLFLWFTTLQKEKTNIDEILYELPLIGMLARKLKFSPNLTLIRFKKIMDKFL